MWHISLFPIGVESFTSRAYKFTGHDSGLVPLLENILLSFLHVPCHPLCGPQIQRSVSHLTSWATVCPQTHGSALSWINED